ncbi:MAG: helix-turn-helix domain-containing protein [Acutalibacteraceae bacterium]
MYNESTEKLNVIGPKLREIRIKRNMSQCVLAQKVTEKGMSRSTATICKIERQQRSVFDYEIQLFAEVLNVPIEEFYKKLML